MQYFKSQIDCPYVSTVHAYSALVSASATLGSELFFAIASLDLCEKSSVVAS